MEGPLGDAEDGGEEGAGYEAFDYEFAELYLFHSVLVGLWLVGKIGDGIYVSYSPVDRLVQ